MSYSSYSSDNDPSSLAVDTEGQMAVTKTLRVCSGLVVLTEAVVFGIWRDERNLIG